MIVGGGIHGCSAALHLAMRGHSVIVLEKDYVARHASGVNAGGVRRLGRDLAEVPIAQAAWQYWREIRALVDDDCGYRPSRYLKVARTESDLANIRRRVQELRALGFEHEEVVDRETVREFLPAAGDHCLGALHVDGDGSALPFRTTRAFMLRAQQLGARFFENTRVNEIARTDGIWKATTSSGVFEAPVIVNAAGAWSGDLAARLGDDVPVIAHAPMLMITARMPAFVTPVVGVFNGTLSFKQFDNGTVLIGGGARGTAYPETDETELNFGGMGAVLRTAKDVFPIMAKANIVRTWAGIEGYLPDNLPVIGPGTMDGVVHVCGFSAHGFQLAPAVGGIVADLVTGSRPDLRIEPFRVDRFNSVREQ